MEFFFILATGFILGWLTSLASYWGVHVFVKRSERQISIESFDKMSEMVEEMPDMELELQKQFFENMNKTNMTKWYYEIRSNMNKTKKGK